MVPETIAAFRSMMISLPSAAISLTGSMDDAARADATAARTVACIAGMGWSMAAHHRQAPRAGCCVRLSFLCANVGVAQEGRERSVYR